MKNSNRTVCTAFNDFSFVTYLVHICIQLSIFVIIKHRFVQSPPLKSSCLFKIQVTILRVTYSLVSWKYVIKDFIALLNLFMNFIYHFFPLTKQLLEVFIFTELEKILDINKKYQKCRVLIFFLISLLKN